MRQEPPSITFPQLVIGLVTLGVAVSGLMMTYVRSVVTDIAYRRDEGARIEASLKQLEESITVLKEDVNETRIRIWDCDCYRRRP